MKLFKIIFVIILPLSSFAQLPTATVISNDTAFCESGEANFIVKFTGVQPFKYQYKAGTDTKWSELIYANTYSFPVPISSTSSIKLLAIYDSNYPAPPNGSTSGTILSSEMQVTIYEKPSINAGDDKSICGLEFDLEGNITGTTENIWWTDVGSLGSFVDSSNPNSKFIGNSPNDYTLTLNAKNGTCEVSDDVIITLKGSPTGSISEGSMKFCSNDGITDNLTVNTSFTGVSDFTYELKNEDSSISYGPFTTSNTSDSQLINVTKSETITLSSIIDGQGCPASISDMTGSKIANDVKPDTYAGSHEDPYCGTEISLSAAITPGTNGIWSSTLNDVSFEDASKENTKASITLNATETYKDVALRWTETTTDEFNCSDFDEINIKFVQPPELVLTSELKDTICEGESSFISYSLSGSIPLRIDYNDNSNSFFEDNITTLLNSLELTPNFDPIESTSSVTEYSFTKITDRFNCNSEYDDKKYAVQVDKLPTAYAGDDDNICAKTIDLMADYPDVGQGTWSGPGIFTNETDPETTFTADNFDPTSGEPQTLTWLVTNGKCTVSDDVNINFNKAPFPVYAGNDTIIYVSNLINLNAAQPEDGNKYNWSAIEGNGSFDNPNTIDAVYTSFEKGIHKLLWKVSLIEGGGCDPDSDTITIDFRPIKAPTGISPDGDGLNDYLVIKGSDNINNNRLSVFNKHGKLVFRKKDYYNEFNGIDNAGSELSAGTYYYVFEGDELKEPIRNYLIIKRQP